MIGGTLDRRAVVARLLAGRNELLVVTGLGSAAYDVMAAGDHDNNYYLWAAMGSAAMVGFGIAMAQPNRSVLVVTGDGEQLMGFGALATIALKKPGAASISTALRRPAASTGRRKSATWRAWMLFTPALPLATG